MDKSQKKLERLRKEIDGLDKNLLQTLRKRFKIVEKISKIKKKLKLPAHQKARWEEMLKERVARGISLKLDKGFTQSLFKLIHKESKRIQGTNRKRKNK
jgi:chorismate mutase